MDKIAILVPCYNEEQTIGKVIRDFKCEVPSAEIYVYDNNSSDKTFEIAKSAGAVVRREFKQGKGFVVRQMFMDIDADIYVLVDGDDTYPVEFVGEMITLVQSGRADMVTGDRLSNGSYSSENKRKFHNLGNNLVRFAINTLFHADIKDVMTGYRVYNKKFVKNWPVMSNGFEIETEMTLHALDKRYVIEEIPIDYRDRPEGSESKLNTFSDGIKVVGTIFKIFKNYRPMLFFGVISLAVCLLGMVCGMPVIDEYIKTHFIHHIPLTILAAVLEMLALNLLTCGLVLDTLVEKNKESYEINLIRFYGKENEKNEEV